MNPEIFREYDIRGRAEIDFDEADVLRLGRAIGTFLRRNACSRVAVGRDCRLTSDVYANQLIRGMISTGCHVKDIGVCSSPVLYFAIGHLKLDGGVMVTASHNPRDDNGFKICIGQDSIHGDQIQTILEMFRDQDFSKSEGTRTGKTVIPDYQSRIIGGISLGRPLRVGVDAGNGTAGVVALPILQKLGENIGCEIHPIYCEMDGNFPNHPADPTVAENMADLSRMVRKKGLDIGIGYDGDGDRLGVVDERGNMVFGDRLMLLFAREILERQPGATFIADVKCSKVLYDDIEARGGKAIMWKTGHSLIKAKMNEVEAVLAGEMSGHFFFEDRYLGYDDGIYASCRLLELLSKSDGTLSDLLADVPDTFNTPEIRIDCPDSRKFRVVKKVVDHFRERYPVIDIDGVRVLFEDGWALVRASNTQAKLVMRFEALSAQRLAEIREAVESVVMRFKESG